MYKYVYQYKFFVILQLTAENLELQKHLVASQESQRFLTKEVCFKSYFESTNVYGEPIFVDFVGRPNHEIWFPKKRRFP